MCSHGGYIYRVHILCTLPKAIQRRKVLVCISGNQETVVDISKACMLGSVGCKSLRHLEEAHGALLLLEHDPFHQITRNQAAMPSKRKQGSREARPALPTSSTAPSEPAANFPLPSMVLAVEREARVLHFEISDDSDAAHQPQKRGEPAAEAPRTQTPPEVVRSRRRLRRANGVPFESPGRAPIQNAARGARRLRSRRGSGNCGSDVKERLLAAQRQFKEGGNGRQRPSDTSTSSSGESGSNASELVPSQSSSAPLEDDLGDDSGGDLEDDLVDDLGNSLEEDLEERHAHSTGNASLPVRGCTQSQRGDMGDGEAVRTTSGEGSDDNSAGFIVKDSEDTEGEGEGAAPEQEDELETLLKALTESLTRESGYIYLTDEWPCYIAGLVFRELAADSWAAKLKVARILDSTRDVISSNLGWVNAEKSGLLRAMKELPLLCTGWDFGGGIDGGMSADEAEELRDGHFTCEACGRSTGPVKPVTLSGRPYHRDQLGRLQWREEEHAVFVVGWDCAQRVMLAHLLQHWEWAVAEKLGAEVKRVYGTISSSAPDRAQLAAMAILADVELVRSLFLRTNQATDLGRKLQTTTGKRRNSQMCSSADVGRRVLRLTNAMDPRHG